MKKVSKIILSSIVAANLVFASGIPVVDAALNAQTMTQNIKQIAEWVKEAERWTNTVSHYKNQLNAYSKELATKIGIRDVVAFLRAIEDLYDQEKLVSIKSPNEGSGHIDDETRKLMDKFLKHDYCEKIQGITDVEKNICKQKREDIFTESVFYTKRSKAVSDISKTMNKLSAKLKQSKDIKESADINNAIQIQIATLEAEKIQIELYQLNKQKQKEAIKERERELYLEGEARPIDLSSVHKYK